jgi:hypothetical protein
MHRLLFSYPDPMPVHWTEAVIREQTLQGYRAVYECLWDLQGDLGPAGTGPPVPVERSFTTAGRAAFIAFANQRYLEAIAGTPGAGRWMGNGRRPGV